MYYIIVANVQLYKFEFEKYFDKFYQMVNGIFQVLRSVNICPTYPPHPRHIIATELYSSKGPVKLI